MENKMFDKQFLQDLKDNKHLSEFGMSQEIIDFANSTKDKYKIIPNFKDGEDYSKLTERPKVGGC